MTVEAAVRNLAGIILHMDWKAFGGEQWLARQKGKARAIIEAFPESETLDVDALRRKIQDQAAYTAGLGLTEHCQNGKQSAYREVLEMLK